MIVTCSGGDSGLAADEAARRGLDLPALTGDTTAALRERLPAAATAGNPLDHTALIWGDREAERDMLRIVGDDPGVGQTLVFFDQPPGLDGFQGESWRAQEEAILAGAEASAVGVLMAATLPELLDDEAAWRFAEAGVPAIAGLRTGVTCAAALAAPPGDSARLREIARPARRATPPPPTTPARWLAEHETKDRLRAAGLPVVPGRLAAHEDDAVAALAEFGPVALKSSAPGLLHKTRNGALALDLVSEHDVRTAFRRLDGPVLVERMAEPGAELLVSVRRDAVVPALVIGLGGVYAEVLDDVAVIPLPASAERVERALRGLRGAALLAGLDVAAAARLAAGLAALGGLELIECNPVLVHRRGAVVVDAVAREVAA